MRTIQRQLEVLPEVYDNKYQTISLLLDLALHRIFSASITPFTFERPKDFNLKQYDDDGRFGYGDGKLIRLSFSIEREAGFHLLESPLSADQYVVELDNTYQITATVVDSAMLEWWLQGFGDKVSNITKTF